MKTNTHGEHEGKGNTTIIPLFHHNPLGYRNQSYIDCNIQTNNRQNVTKERNKAHIPEINRE